jgi:hypothetical protein
MRVISSLLIAALTSLSPVFAQQEFFPIAKGAKWEYRVTFPANVKLPYYPVVEVPEGLLAASFVCGLGSWTAGQTNFDVNVRDIAEQTTTSTTWNLATSQQLLKFLFFQTDTTMCTCQLRLKNDGTVQDLSVLMLMNIATPPWRMAKYVSRISASNLVQRYPVTVPAGQYSSCVLCTMILNGDGRYVPSGTYPVDTYLAPGVGIVKAVGKDPAGATQYTLELTKFTAGGAVSVESDHAVPMEFALLQNFPNPFNPSTRIQFDIPHSSFVNLKVYNALGVEVATLVSAELPAGRHDATWNVGGASSGIYFYRMQAGTYTQTRKMLLVR